MKFDRTAVIWILRDVVCYMRWNCCTDRDDQDTRENQLQRILQLIFSLVHTRLIKNIFLNIMIKLYKYKYSIAKHEYFKLLLTIL